VQAIYLDCLPYLASDDVSRISARFDIVESFSYNPSVVVALIRPPQVYSDQFIKVFPNLRVILSDTTGVTHLSEAFLNKSLNVYTLRDLSPSDRDDLTAASELAHLLISLSLRPVLSCHHRLIRSFSESDTTTDIFLPRSSYLGLTWHDVKLGFIGAGRIATSVASFLPDYIGSLSYFDPYIPVSKVPNCGTRVSSLDDLFGQSNIILLSATDDPQNEDLINDVLLRHHLHALINISRPYMVNSTSLLSSLRSGKLKYYYSDFQPPDLSPSELSPFVRDGSMLFLPHIGGATHHSWRNSLAKILTFLPS